MGLGVSWVGVVETSFLASDIFPCVGVCTLCVGKEVGVGFVGWLIFRVLVSNILCLRLEVFVRPFDIARLLGEDVGDGNGLLFERDFDDKAVTACVAVFRVGVGGVEVLLCRRKSEPSAGEWALPGGHEKEGELPEETACRELFEETGVRVGVGDLVLVGMRPGDVGRSKRDYVFAVRVGDVGVRAGSDCGGLRWVGVEGLPPLAFQDDEYVLQGFRELFGDEGVNEVVGRLLGGVIVEGRDYRGEVVDIMSRKSPTDKGLLIVFEGPDGAGKTTQCDRLVEWLEGMDYKVVRTKWNSSPLLKDTIKKAKDERILSPVLFSLLHAADLVLRYEHDIVPALEKNKIVVCDRYTFTSLVRDGLRGMDVDIVRDIYKNLREPDVVFYCRVPVEVAFSRLVNDKGLSYYGTGMDLNLSKSREENCIKYEKLMSREYDKLLKGGNVCRLDMDRSVKKIFRDIREYMMGEFGIGKYID